MTFLLAGDIGGTKTILRLVERTNTAALNTLYEFRYSSKDFPDLIPMVQQFLTTANTQLGYIAMPEKACFALAGPVINNTAKLTNLPWLLAAQRLENDLEIAQVSLINDFAAIGYGVLGLEPQDLHNLQTGKAKLEAPIAVIGAGTGLGECFLIRQEKGVKVFATEGGHADFAPRSELEFQLLKYLLAKHDIQRISVERVVSGLGIVAIYQFLSTRKFANESPEIEKVMRTWSQEIGQSEKTIDPAAIIARTALEKGDYLCEKTMEMFVEAYGAEAGNLALKLLPYGGLYIAGGIAAKILPLIKAGGFMRAFTHKGRMDCLLETIPVNVVLNPQVGLIGAAIYAASL